MTFAYLALLAPAAALPGAEPYEDADEVVVTGRAPERPAGDRAYAAVALDRERLADTPSGRLDQALREAPGFQLFRRLDARSANPTAGGPTLRGLGGNGAGRVQVLLDGVPQADPFGGWIAWPALDPNRLGGARVVRGGGTGAGGPGALAGTVLLESAGPDDLPRLGADASVGTRGSRDMGEVASGFLGGGWASLSGRLQSGDGFVPIVRADRGLVDRRAPYRQSSVAGRVLLPLDGAELQLSGLAFDDRRTRGLPDSDIRTQGLDASARLVGRGVTATAWRQQRDFSNLFASANRARDAATLTLDQYAVPATGTGAAVEVRPSLGGVEVRFGADAREARGETRERFQFIAGAPTRGRVAGGRTRIAGAYAEASWEASDALVLTGGVRLDRWRIDRGRSVQRDLAGGAVLADERPADRAGWRPTARAGVAWRPAGAVTVRAAGYAGWRLPTLNELYRPFRLGPDAVAANPRLAPERLQGGEIGLDYQPLSAARLSVTVFDNRLADAIANVTVARGPGVFPPVGFVGGEFRRRLNLDAIRTRGVEADARVELRDWSLSGGLGYADARVRANGAAAALDGRRPAQAPRWTGTARAEWRRDGARASLVARYVGAQFEDDANGLRLRPALTLDGFAAADLGRGVRVEARAENLFDAAVDAALSSDRVLERATPRTLWLGLAWAFADPR